jgi:membrane fusion protein, multidrug efflux system
MISKPATARRIVDAAPAAPVEAPAPGRRRSALLRPRNVIALIVSLVVLILGAIELHQRLTHVFEYDARVTTDLITISSRVSGQLTTLAIQEGYRIRKGEVLATIDSRASEFRVRALEAQLRGLEAERERLNAQRRLLADQIRTRSASRESAVSASSAERAALEAEMRVAKAELERAEALYDRRVISNRQVDRARADLQKLQSDMRKAEAEILGARSGVQEVKVERTGLDVIDNELDMLTAQANRLDAELAQQRVDLEDRRIRSPIDGVVDRTFAEAGEYVGAGQRLALIHDPDRLWVEANIKETQVSRLRVGQPVEVTVDAFSDGSFSGRVERIGTSTTSNFALLPTPNPSGNFTKITQRVPVRIALDPTDRPLSPGMMVEVNIDVRDR